MYQNKDNQKEIIVLEASVWAFWVFLFGVVYLFA